jgi:lipoprotein-anchoring transpeptidase ErfK/SrfK
MFKSFIAATLMAAVSFSALPSVASAAVGKDKSVFSIFSKKKVVLKKKKGSVVVVSKTKVRQSIFASSTKPVAKKTFKVAANNRTCIGLDCLFGGPRKSVRISSGFQNRKPVRGSNLSIFRSSGVSGRSMRAQVAWSSSQYPIGSIVVRTPERALYHITGNGVATRYRVGVGKEGFTWGGTARIAAKKEWPSWTPPQEMIEREALKGRTIPDFMEGGPGNPLGARALYIGGTIYRVHGTNNEGSIGGAVSSGCIRMMNADIIDLYNKVKVGSRIYVLQ